MKNKNENKKHNTKLFHKWIKINKKKKSNNLET